MSNWSHRNDHEVSAVTLMMGLCERDLGETAGEHCNFRGIDSQREHHFSNRVKYKMIVISCSMNQGLSGVADGGNDTGINGAGSTTMDHSIANYNFDLIAT